MKKGKYASGNDLPSRDGLRAEETTGEAIPGLWRSTAWRCIRVARFGRASLFPQRSDQRGLPMLRRQVGKTAIWLFCIARDTNLSVRSVRGAAQFVVNAWFEQRWSSPVIRLHGISTFWRGCSGGAKEGREGQPVKSTGPLLGVTTKLTGSNAIRGLITLYR